MEVNVDFDDFVGVEVFLNILNHSLGIYSSRVPVMAFVAPVGLFR